MKDKTETLKAELEDSATGPGTEIYRIREFWRDDEDCDVEIRIGGSNADLGSMLKMVQEHDRWTVKWFTFPEHDTGLVHLCLDYHAEDPSGTMFTADLW